MKIERYYDCFSYLENERILGILHTDNYGIQKSYEKSNLLFFLKHLNKEEISFFWSHLKIFFIRYTEKHNIDADQLYFERVYVNCHPAFHPGDWHRDGEEGLTLLYYPDNEVDFKNEGGLEIEGHGVESYVPNSLIIMPAEVLHRAQIHTIIGQIRFSVAFKMIYTN